MRDGGQGVGRPLKNMAYGMATEKLLAKYLGGRYQEGGTPEVMARLKEVTVDPKTVVLAKKVDPNSVGTPKLAVDLQPGTYKYKKTITMGGREMALNLSSTIQNGSDGSWTASDVTDTPMGQVTDTATLEKGTLTLRTRSVKQGPATITVNSAGNKATGTLNMNRQNNAIAAG